MEKLLVALTLCQVLIAMMKPTAVAIIGQSPKEVEDWLSNLNQSKPLKVTKLHFYCHDSTNADKNLTAVYVAKAPISSKPPFFGSFSLMDDPLTAGSDISSKRVGYAKGFYATSSLEKISLLTGAVFVFTEGKYNGSTIVFLGNNPIMEECREMPVIGGTGVFRLARGVVTLQTYFFNFTMGVAVVEMSVVVLHY